MNKHKKAQTTIGQIMIMSFLFIVLTVGGFNFYLHSLYASGTTTPAGIDAAALNKTFASFEEKYGETSDEIKTNKEEVPFFEKVKDFFAAGKSSITSVWDALGFMEKYIQFVQDNTVIGRFLPGSFFSLFGALVTIIITFVGLGALWRYQFVK